MLFLPADAATTAALPKPRAVALYGVMVKGGARMPAGHEGPDVVELDTPDALLVVSINQSYPRLGAYDAARYAWRVSPSRASQVEYVLATKDRTVVAVFEPTEWHPATRANFPGYERELRGRLGFVGHPARGDAAARYLGKQLPPGFRFSGNGYRYAGSLGD